MVDADQVRHTAASDGCFPLITNDHDLTNTAVLIAYRYQPNLEKRHHLTRDRHTVQTFEPQLTPLQTQLLDLLAVPTSAYTSQP